MIQPIKQVSDRFSMPSLEEFYPWTTGAFAPRSEEEKEAHRRWRQNGGSRSYEEVLAEVEREFAERDRIRKGHLH